MAKQQDFRPSLHARRTQTRRDVFHYAASRYLQIRPISMTQVRRDPPAQPMASLRLAVC